MSIEHTVIEGRDATVIYMKDDWEPCDKKEATMAKVRFADGEVVMLKKLDSIDAE